MNSPEILNFKELTAPIAPEQPAGIDLHPNPSHSSPYQQIKDASAAAFDADRKAAEAEDTGEAPRADWRRVHDLAIEILSRQSKDLDVSAWLIVALLREYEFAGLRDGLRLTRELCELYWDGIYPLPSEDEGYASRLAKLSGVFSARVLPSHVRSHPITAAGTVRALSLVDFQQAARLESRDPELRAQRIAAGAISMQTCDEASQSTPTAKLQNLADDLTACLSELARLSNVLDTHCSRVKHGIHASPSVSELRESLEDCQRMVQGFLKGRQPVAGGPPAGQNSPEVHLEDNGKWLSPSTGPASTSIDAVQTREAAFRALLQVADFFERTEPHSPVSYALAQAVRWGKMPLPELLTELISDEKARSELFRVVGIADKKPAT